MSEYTVQDVLDALSRSRWLPWLAVGTGLFVLGYLFLYYVVGCVPPGFCLNDRELRTDQLDAGLVYTVPATLHAGPNVYTLYLHTGTVPGPTATPTTTPAPLPTSTPVVTVPLVVSGQLPVTSQVTVTITGVSGVVLLPDQPLSFTFTSEMYQSFAISLVHDFADNGEASLWLATSRGPKRIVLQREHVVASWLRRLIAEPIGGAVVTTLLPALLIVLGLIAARRQSQLVAALQQVEQDVNQLLQIGPNDVRPRSSDREADLEQRLVRLEDTKPSFRTAEQQRLDQVSLWYRKLIGLLNALEGGRYDQAGTLVSEIRRHSTWASAPHAPLKELMDELATYLDRQQPAADTQLAVSGSLPFVNQRLAWLRQLGLLQRIDNSSIDALLKQHNEQKLILEQPFLNQLRTYQRLGTPLLPPFYPADDWVHIRVLKLTLPVELPFDPAPYFELHTANRVIVLSGAPRSGRSTALELFQRVRRQQGSLYLAPVPAEQLLQPEIRIRVLSSMIGLALWRLTAQNPDLSIYLSDPPQRDHAALQHLFNSQPPEADVGRMRERLQLALLAEQLRALRLDKLCVALDDAPRTEDYVLLHQQIQDELSLHGVEVFLRLVRTRAPELAVGFVHLPLQWDSSSLARLLGHMTKEPAWRIGLSSEVPAAVLLEQVCNPYELEVWIYALRTCYDERDLTSLDWERLLARMQQARRHSRGEATDWQLEDALRARQELVAP